MDILFDIDGTLVRTYPIEDEFYDRALGTVGLSMPTFDYQELGASTDVSILRVLAQRAWQRDPRPEEIERVRDTHTRSWSEHLEQTPIEVLPGARATLSELRERGVRFAAATGGFRVTATTKLLAAGLEIEIAARPKTVVIDPSSWRMQPVPRARCTWAMGSGMRKRRRVGG